MRRPQEDVIEIETIEEDEIEPSDWQGFIYGSQPHDDRANFAFRKPCSAGSRDRAGGIDVAAPLGQAYTQQAQLLAESSTAIEVPFETC